MLAPEVVRVSTSDMIVKCDECGTPFVSEQSLAIHAAACPEGTSFEIRDDNVVYQQFIAWLRKEVEQSDGPMPFKSRDIVDRVDCTDSTAQIGMFMSHVERFEDDIEVDRLGYAGATIWEVRPSE